MPILLTVLTALPLVPVFQRVELFQEAVSELRASVPVNVILFPMEGDPMAPSLFWRLALGTGGANRIRPNLWDVVGRDIAGVEGFRYSNALSGKDGDWTFDNLEGFLAGPRDWAPGTSMSYAGVRKEDDLANLIAWLRTLSDDPVPLP